MLAESEHRLNFRPYIDGIYTLGETEHKFDTMPGTHGGINELTGNESEAAALVLNRAVRFLQENGSSFRPEADPWLLSDTAVLSKYSQLMMRIKSYKKHATVNPFKSLKNGVVNLAMSSFNVDKHRIVNVAGSKQTWGTDGHVLPDADTRGRRDHHGLGMNTALQQMGRDDPHGERTNRFFANQEHENLFRQYHGRFFQQIQALEMSGNRRNVEALQRAILDSQQELMAMELYARSYFYAYCKKRGVLP
jgi:hypothetical protein